MSSIFSLNWKDIAGAVVSAIIIGVLGYLSKVTDISHIDYSQLLNIAVLTGIASLLKSLGTNESGQFLGSFRVK